MEWRDIAPLVGAIAPTAGKILGGLIPFPGGALIGEQFGRIIARQFGVPETPDAVKEAVARYGNDQALAKIAAATEEARARIDGFVRYETAVLENMRANADAVNQTMRLELLPENRHLFFTGGRAAAMWILVVYLTALGGSLLFAAVVRDDQTVKALSDTWHLHAMIIGALCAVVGVLWRAPERDRPVALPPKVK